MLKIKEVIRDKSRLAIYVVIALIIAIGLFFITKSLNTSHAGGFDYQSIGSIFVQNTSLEFSACVEKDKGTIEFQVIAVNSIIVTGASDLSILASYDNSSGIPLNTNWKQIDDYAGIINSSSNFSLSITKQKLKIGAEIGDSKGYMPVINVSGLRSCTHVSASSTGQQLKTYKVLNPACPKVEHGFCHMELLNTYDSKPTYLSFVEDKRIAYVDSVSSYPGGTLNPGTIGLYDLNSMSNIEFASTTTNSLFYNNHNNKLYIASLVNGYSNENAVETCDLSFNSIGDMEVLNDFKIVKDHVDYVHKNIGHYCTNYLDNLTFDQKTIGKVIALKNSNNYIYSIVKRYNGWTPFPDDIYYCEYNSGKPKCKPFFLSNRIGNNYVQISDIYQGDGGTVYVVVDNKIYAFSQSYITNNIGKNLDSLPNSVTVYNTNFKPTNINYAQTANNPNNFASHIQYLTENPANHFIYFTSDLGKIGIINPTKKTVSYVDIPENSKSLARAEGITIDANNNVWFAVFNYDQLGELKISNNAISTVKVDFNGVNNNGQKTGSNDVSGPFDIVLGSDQGLWFTEYKANRIGEYLP